MSIITFSYNNQTIRVITDSNCNAWFYIDDIVVALEYKNTTELSSNIDLWDISSFVIPTTSSKGIKQYRKVNTINEFGLYSAILNSCKLEVITFKDWIITQVLPSIRKTWTYSVNCNGTGKLN